MEGGAVGVGNPVDLVGQRVVLLGLVDVLERVLHLVEALQFLSAESGDLAYAGNGHVEVASFSEGLYFANGLQHLLPQQIFALEV